MENEVENKERPTVVHAINNLDVGGVETMALETIRHFEEWGENRLVVVDGRRQPRRPAFDDLGIPISVWDHRPGEYEQLVRKSARYFRSVEADALLCWSYGNHAFVGMGAWLGGVSRSVVSVQNAPPAEPLPLWKWRVLGWVGLPFVSRLVTCSEYVRDRMVAHVGIPERKLQTIYNGCDVRGVNEKASSALPAESDRPIIGMVARLNKIKDQSTLVKAMPSILEKYPGAELWIVGDGNQRESLETLSESMELEGNVQLLGNRSDVPSLLGKMDVFAFSTTEAEGFGIAIIEALAAEVPVVATDVGPCAEVLRGGKWGHLVPKKRPQRLGEKVIEVLESDRWTPDVEEVYRRYDKRISAEMYWKYLKKVV